MDDAGVNLYVEIERPCKITATPGAMEQVLDNMLSNALAAAPAGSTDRTCGPVATAESMSSSAIREPG